MRLLPTTVRMKLALTAAVGLVVMVLMAAMVHNTSNAAYDVVVRTRADHERMRAFARLHAAGDELQRRAYEAARIDAARDMAGSAAAQATLAGARREFQRQLEHAVQVSRESDRGRELLDALRTQGAEVLALFARVPDNVRAVNAAGRDGGGQAALRELQRFLLPYVQFTATVEAEIQRSDGDVAAATLRAISLQNSMRTAALLGLALGITGTAAIVGVLLLRLGPALLRLERGARAFGAGNLQHRVSVGGGDELTRLAGAFNSMAQELADKQEALEDSRAGLGRAVAVRTAELNAANAALSAEDERRRRFLADASHELRIPVTIIRGEAQVALRSGASAAPEAAEAFERILKQTRDVTRLLDDLFLIARAEAGGLGLSLERIDINELVTRMAHDFATLAIESGATVTAQVEGRIEAHVDAGRLRQALAALVDNALRHTRRGVNVVIQTRLDGDGVRIAVDDDGPGIAESDATDLFGRFRRGATRGEGSGLGLSVVRALAEAHGGTASLDRSATGGVSAVLRLPLAARVAARAVA